MLFNSAEFLLIFLPTALIAFALARRSSQTAALVVLLCGSLIFYSVWTVKYTPALILSMLVNFWIAKRLQQQRSKRLLAAGIVVNLAPLLWIKYAHWVGGLIGVDIDAMELPLGISFVTFLQIAFLVEAWSGKLPPVHGLRYLVFVSYFPHLIAGPILRYGEIDPQLRKIGKVRVTDEQIARAMLLIVVGLFKKVVLADKVGAVVDPIYASAATATFWEAWTAAIGYTVQLYLDFSGMCEIALGVSLLFGITIPLNFFSPYKAPTITDFWRRWHMTLSAWFRDFVYVPLGGNRHGLMRALAALLTTMLLAGIWHGAANTFVLWGLMHGVMLAAHKLWLRQPRRLPDWAGHWLTLGAVVLAWVPFRATSVSDTTSLWAAMAGLKGVALPDALAPLMPWLPATSMRVSGAELVVFATMLVILATAKNVHEWRLSPGLRWSAGVTTAAMAVGFSLSQPTTFIYWNW